MELTSDQIAAIRERNEARTPGKWRYWPNDTHEDDVRVCQEEDQHCICCLALMGDMQEEEWTTETIATWENDARFIAACSEDVPNLLETLDARDERIKRLEEALGWYAGRDIYQGCLFADGTYGSAAKHDSGQRARHALGEKGDGK